MLRRLLPIVVAVVGLLDFPGGLPARQATSPQPAGTPEDALRKSFEARRGERIEEYAATIDPEALNRFQKSMMAIVDRATEEERQVIVSFFGSLNIEELRKQTPAQCFTTIYQKVVLESPLLKWLFRGGSKQIQLTVLGSVSEGADGEIIHIVHRTTIGRRGIHASEFMADFGINASSLRRVEGRWLMLPRELEAMVEITEQVIVQTAAEISGKPIDPAKTESIKIQLLGRILEEDRAAHVVYRTTVRIGGSDRTWPSVLTVKKSNRAYAAVREGRLTDVIPLIREEIRSNLSTKTARKPTAGKTPNH